MTAPVQGLSSTTQSLYVKYVLWTVLALVALIAVSIAAFFIGSIAGQRELYHSIALEQAESMRRVLDRSPNRFHSVTIHEASNGWSYYFGSVSTEEDRDFLLSESERIFGESLGRKMVRAVLIDEMK